MSQEIDLFADTEMPKEEGLSRLSHLFQERQRLADHVEALRAELKVTEEELRGIDEQKFPELFDEVGIDSFSVGNRKISLEEKLYGSLPKDEVELADAMVYLKEHGGESLVKVQVTVDFNKGESSRAEETAKLIQAAGYNPVLKETVHAQTLQKFGRDLIKTGELVDLKRLGLYNRRFVKVA